MPTFEEQARSIEINDRVQRELDADVRASKLIHYAIRFWPLTLLAIFFLLICLLGLVGTVFGK